ncbi:MAG: amino acid ABC transporter permease, partial [Oscillospiraceae bacterium]|nr:amino acid ABC transporter permease [Oscillospiraceae bacterium]
IAVVVALIQFANIPVANRLCRFYIWVFRGTPLLVQLMVVFYGFPEIGIRLEAFPAAVIVFALNEGAYASEIVRAALEAVPAGQMEAGYCVGMSYLQTMRRIILPQAMRTAVPSLANSLISMTKDTSLASNITVAEMMLTTRTIIGAKFVAMPLYLEVGFIYLMMSTVLTFVQSWLEKKLNAHGHQGG